MLYRLAPDHNSVAFASQTTLIRLIQVWHILSESKGRFHQQHLLVRKTPIVLEVFRNQRTFQQIQRRPRIIMRLHMTGSTQILRRFFHRHFRLIISHLKVRQIRLQTPVLINFGYLQGCAFLCQISGRSKLDYLLSLTKPTVLLLVVGELCTLTCERSLPLTFR